MQEYSSLWSTFVAHGLFLDTIRELKPTDPDHTWDVNDPINFLEAEGPDAY